MIKPAAARPELRWPSVPTILACCAVAAVTVAIDAYFNAQQGYLSRALDYDGVSYMSSARTAYLLMHSLHIRTGLHALNGIVPLWLALLAFQHLILGDGTWQAFTARFWPVALLLTLVYWIVRRRATRPLAIAAVALTALLPVVSAGVRASSWEFLSGQANYYEDWWLDDLRPDFLAIVLVLCSVAVLAEHSHAPRRSTYLVSAALAAAAVLAKASTSPVALVAWLAALAVTWYWNRRTPGVTSMTALAVGFLTLLLVPWAVVENGAQMTWTYLFEGATAFRAAYATNLGFPENVTYYLVRLPGQLGRIEAWPVIVATAYLALALLRRRLGRPELIYAGLVVLFFTVFTIPAGKNPLVGMWITLSLWIFFLAGAARLASVRWPGPLTRASPAVLAAVGAYVVIIYALGAFALAGWPAAEQQSNAQLRTVTAELAQELGRHITVGQCFTYAPGPGWPASIDYLLMDSTGNAPFTTRIDVDPAATTVQDYVDSAKTCPAVIAYRENITQVAQMFFAPAVRQPYLQAVADWVRSPNSGYALDRTWRFSDLAPSGPHTLGRYQGVSLTVDLYLRTTGT